MARTLTLTVLLSILFCSTAFAFNYRDLRTAPIAWFSDKDVDMMEKTFYDAMDNNDDGVTSDWKNEKTGNHGRITPVDRFEEKGNPCRTVKVENYAGTNHATTQLKFCKTGGKWQMTE